jgi:hypothetical protein
MPREHGADGAFVETVPLDDVLRVFRRVRGPVVFSADVADQLGCSRETGRRKLEALYERGDVDRRKVSRRVVYWRHDDANRPATEGSEASVEAAESAERVATTQSRDRTEDQPRQPTATERRSDALEERVRSYLSDRPPRTAHGTAAIIDVFRLLRERGTMRTGELKRDLYPSYSDHYGSERTMWESVSRYVADVPGVEKGGYGEWTYAGDADVRETLDRGDSQP